MISKPLQESYRREIQRQARLEYWKRSGDILAWGKYYFPEKFSQPFCTELHQYLVDIRDLPFTDTLAPRNHAKTTIQCFVIPIYQAYNEPETYKHYLNIQNTSTKASGINTTIRTEIENNDLLRADYGCMVDSKKWTERQYVLKNGVVFTAIGVGESVRGINYDSKRPDYIIADDLYDEDDINNPDRIKKKEAWFWGSIYPARSQNTKTSIHLQGTAINKDDLMHKLAKREDIKFRKFQAIKDMDAKITLWFDFDQLLKDRELMGSVIFEREMQNNCRDDANSIIKLGWIKLVERLPQKEWKQIKCGADPAVGLKEHNDYTAMSAGYFDEDNNCYIMPMVNDHLSFNDTIKTADTVYKQSGCTKFILEAISGFDGLAQEIARKTDVPLHRLSSVKDKITRLENVSHKFENGKVFIVKNQFSDILVEQLINNFPDHDDLRDSVVSILEDQGTNIQDWLDYYNKK